MKKVREETENFKVKYGEKEYFKNGTCEKK
jgi:hypothetical protein